MFTKTKLALAAAVIFCAVPAVQAANENDGGNETGGFHTGPLGQHFGGSFYRGSRHYAYRYGSGPFAFVPGYHRHWQWRRD